jgi:hypothetical protein
MIVPAMIAPQLEFAMEAHVTVAAPLDAGLTPRGERRVIPITGGTFEGPSLRGRVIPGGADWQRIWPDHVAELEARYTLETESGGLILVVNRGFRHGPPEVLKLLREGVPVDKSSYYFRTSAVFETSVPELAWLMRSVFIGDAERFPDHVSIRFWRVI